MKKLLIIPFLLLLSLIASAETYYVSSSDGDDDDTGLTEALAWATISKVNAATFAAGDSILFKRGDTWRIETINSDNGTSSGYVYYGAYGTGAKPLMLGSKEENSTGDWADQGGNIWQNSDANFTVDVGNIIFNNGDTCGVKIMSASPTLDAQGEFWYDFTNDLIQIYSVGNPASYYTDIECVLSLNAVYREAFEYVIFQNLDFRNWGQCAVYMWGGANHNKFLDLDISFIGGGDMLDDYTTRYGNGITVYGAANNIEVSRCIIHDVYDAGISPQGAAGAYSTYNWYSRNNIIYKCEYSYEFWYMAGVTVSEIYFENNTCLYAGGGWSHNQRPDGVMGHHVNSTTYYCTNGANLNIRNNIFYESTQSLYHAGQLTGMDGLTIDYNCVYTTGTRMGEEDTDLYSTFSDWTTATSHDLHSVNANPLLVSSTDFHLQVGSPAKDTGVQLGYQVDFDGTAIGYLPDIGAYEFEDIRMSVIDGKLEMIGTKRVTVRK